MAAKYKLLIDNDNYFVVIVRNSKTDEFIDDATVEVTLYTEAGSEVTDNGGDAGWPATMPHIDNSDGKYEYTFQQTLDLTPQADYYAIVEVDGEGLQARRRYNFRAVSG